MKNAISFWFVVTFSLVPTLGILRFVTENLARTDEYAVSDLNTTFGLITIDLAAGQQVLLEAPETVMTPHPGLEISFLSALHDPNNNWIDGETGHPFDYSVMGQSWDIQIEQGLIHLVELQWAELEGGSSLRLNLTVRIETMEVISCIDCNGRLRFRTYDIDNGIFGAALSNLVLGYEGRFQLYEREGQRYVGPSIGQSTMTVNGLTVNGVVITDIDHVPIYLWDRTEEVDGDYMDDLFSSVLSSVFERVGGTVDNYLRALFENQPYAAEHTTLVSRVANASGYSCRRPEPRPRRETKLYNT